MHFLDFLWWPVAYLCGSVPYGFLAGKICGVDLRTVGSGNIGATNAFRVLGRGWGSAVFLLDFLKGFVPVWMADELGFSDLILVGSAVLVVVGHNFPVWLGFRGGKGIATSAGVILGLFPKMVFVSALLVWVVVFFATRFVSVASLAAALTLTVAVGVFFALGQTSGWLLGVAAVMTTLAVLRHRSNIRRLLEGTEPRFTRGAQKMGQASSPPPAAKP